MMAKKTGSLEVLSPQPVNDERTPLLGESGGDGDGLEAQAEQEQREHAVGATPVADEPSTRKLLLTMWSLWVSTFFAALDATVVAVCHHHQQYPLIWT